MEAEKREKPTSTLKPFNQSQNNTKPIKVWDPFVRVTHWTLVVAFASAYVSGSDWRVFHVGAGYGVLFLLALRVLWGVWGSRSARFVDFVTSPAETANYVYDIFAGREKRYLGHNPAGGAMTVLLLVLLAAVSASGVLLTTDTFWGSTNMELIHAWGATVTLVCVVTHVAGVIVMSIRHRENLVRSMFTGYKHMQIMSSARKD